MNNYYQDKLITGLKLFKSHFIFILILIIATSLRFYKIETLTTFGRDQGIDFISVYNMIVSKKLTLIGIKVSIGEFFQGPIYLYLLAPLFLILNFNPIAGAYTAVFISIITIVTIYIVTDSFFGKLCANFSAFLFAVSPEFVAYGNTPLYQHFAPVFMMFGLWFLSKFIVNNKSIYALLVGIFAGLSMETHWLFVSFAISGLIYFGFFKELKSMFIYLIGLFSGLLPTIIFELRHNFLNLNLFIDYIKNSHSNYDNIWVKIMMWLKGSALFISGENIYLGGLVIFVFIVALIFAKFTTKKPKHLIKFFWVLFFLSTIISMIVSQPIPHYFLPLWIMAIIILPAILIKTISTKWGTILLIVLIGFNLLATISRFDNNHGYYMPQGWSLKNIKKTAEIIDQDAKSYSNINVASLLDGDTRSYPLRYSLLVKGVSVGKVEDYPNNDHLYLVASSSQDIQNNIPWEVSIMMPFEIGNSWDLKDNLILYRLDRQ